ncbi:MAG: hypothetical protein MJZ40_02275 [Bacteroidaceae bacterium]|nr:hypothetical protein [Bacteroidaceae bacterium]
MTKFLQRLQLTLWAVAIVMAIIFQFTGTGELSTVPAVATYIFNLVGVVLVLVAGYFVMVQRRHRILRLVTVNMGILCTEALYFMMTPKGSTMMYCFLLCLLLSLAAYPIKEPKNDSQVEEDPIPAKSEASETAEPSTAESANEAPNS